MLRSLNSGVTGLRNHQVRIDVIGNNIANVNTTGYKAQRAEFQTLVSQTLKEGTMPASGRGGTNAQQVGLGIAVGSITNLQSQGALQYTGKSTDLGMQGEGYFILSDGKKQAYTRDGSFDFDRQGTYLSPASGLKVQGWMAVNGKIEPNGVPGDIQIARGLNLQPKQTTNVELKGNLKSDTNDIVIDGVLKGNVTPGQVSIDSPVDVSMKILNSKNEIVHGKLTFAQIPNTLTWGVKYEVDAGDQDKISGNASQDLGSVTFDASGKLISNTMNTLRVAFKPEYGASPIEANVIPSQLTMKPDVPTSRIGLQPAAGENDVAPGAKGLVQAGRYTMTVNFFDALGNSHAGNLVFSRDLSQQMDANKTAGGTSRWRVSFTTSDPGIRNDTATNPGPGVGGLPIDMGTVNFDQSGLLVESAISPLTLKYVNGSADSLINFNPGKRGEISGLTQFTTSSTALVQDQDGYTSGTLQGLSIDDSGTIAGVFTNGQIKQLAQVAVATFNNPQGLLATGGNLLSKGNNSGDAQIGTASTGGRAAIAAGNLELSNVDLAGSFADLIVTQRGFQANSRIITTSDEMLQELIQLKR